MSFSTVSKVLILLLEVHIICTVVTGSRCRCSSALCLHFCLADLQSLSSAVFQCPLVLFILSQFSFRTSCHVTFSLCAWKYSVDMRILTLMFSEIIAFHRECHSAGPCLSLFGQGPFFLFTAGRNHQIYKIHLTGAGHKVSLKPHALKKKKKRKREKSRPPSIHLHPNILTEFLFPHPSCRSSTTSCSSLLTAAVDESQTRNKTKTHHTSTILLQCNNIAMGGATQISITWILKLVSVLDSILMG